MFFNLMRHVCNVTMNKLFHLLSFVLNYRVIGASVVVKPNHHLALGFDFGTSGARFCLIDANRAVLRSGVLLWTNIGDGRADNPVNWQTALYSLLDEIPERDRSLVSRICVSGTSASTLVFDQSTGEVSRRPRMYNFNVLQKCENKLAKATMEFVESVCPKNNAAFASTSTFAKLVAWQLESKLCTSERLVHQADYIQSELLMDDIKLRTFTSDWHNALKVGFDVVDLKYPDWLIEGLITLGIDLPEIFLPKVVEPGKPVGPVSERICKLFQLPPDCVVVGGTTDSIAAFLATGPTVSPGRAVTSLGSTLAIKLLSTRHIEDAKRGVYSHRLGNLFLVGGASNVGCAVFRALNFSDSELDQLSTAINPMRDSGLQYYALPPSTVGERFPVNDPYKTPILGPVPSSRAEYLHGLLEAIAVVERDGYRALEELGATPPLQVG